VASGGRSVRYDAFTHEVRMCVRRVQALPPIEPRLTAPPLARERREKV
jgi:hypothetical protein